MCPRHLCVLMSQEVDLTVLWDKHPHVVINGIVGQTWSKPCEALTRTLSSRYFELENEKWVVLFVLPVCC